MSTLLSDGEFLGGSAGGSSTLLSDGEFMGGSTAPAKPVEPPVDTTKSPASGGKLLSDDEFLSSAPAAAAEPKSDGGSFPVEIGKGIAAGAVSATASGIKGAAGQNAALLQSRIDNAKTRLQVMDLIDAGKPVPAQFGDDLLGVQGEVYLHASPEERKGLRESQQTVIDTAPDPFTGKDQPSPGPTGDFKGLVEPGNIDLAKRPIVKNADGTISTVRSMSYENDAGQEVLIPTVSEEGKVMSNHEAIKYWGEKGKFLGKFDNADDATAYALALHEAQDKFYNRPESSIADAPLFKAGAATQAWSDEQLKAAKDYEGSWTRAISEGLGSTVPFLLSRGAGGLAAGSAMSAGQQIDDAIKHGATKEQIIQAVKLGSLPGLTEQLPIETLFERIPLPLYGKMAGAIGKVLGQAAAEGGQEAVQQVAQNLIAKYVYNPDQDLTDGVVQAGTIGAIVGAGMKAVEPHTYKGEHGKEPAASVNGQSVPEGAASADTLFGQESAGEPPPSSADTAAGGPPPPPAATSTEVDRPNSPRLTPEDRASPLPNNLIDDGKKIFDEALSGGKKQPTAAADVAPLDGQIITPAQQKDAAQRVADIAGEFGPPASQAARPALEHTIDGTLAGAEPASAPARTLTDREFIHGISAVDDAAHVAATSRLNDRAEPTQAMKEAGNYAKGHTTVGGLDVSIENPQGSTRSGVDPNGKSWTQEMQSHYGYIRGTVGKDKDHIDVFIKPGTPPEMADNAPVFVVDQRSGKGGFDEHKVMMGFATQAEADAGYHANYQKGWKGAGAITQTTLGEFKGWLANGDTTKPFQTGPKSSSVNQIPENAASGQPASAPTPVDVKQRAAPVQKGPRDIIQFLARSGGVQDFKGELRAIDAHKTFVPGAGKLMREKGMPLDRAREAAAQEGYFDAKYGDRNTASEKSTVADLLDLIAETRRGNRQYVAGEQGTAAAPQEVDRQQQEIEALAKEHGLQLTEGLTSEILDLMASGMAADEAIVDVIERQAIADEAETHDVRGQGEPNLDDIPFLNEAGAADKTRQGAEDQGRDRQGPVEGSAREAAPQREQSGSAEPNGSRQEVKPTVEAGAEGKPQTVIPGAEKISQAQQAQREADKPLRAKAPQKDAGELFDTQARREKQDELFALRREGPRQQGIPDSAVSIAPFTSDAAIKAHPDYRAAKAGDQKAAERMVADLVPDSSLEKAVNAFGTDVIYAPVIAHEASGHNAIPWTLANYYAARTGAQSTTNIYQANKAFHTGATAMERLAVRATFGGEVVPGGRYVIVDDVTVMGSTLADMAHYIQSNGGEVAGVVTLANASRTGVLVAPKHRTQAIERRFGDVVRSDLKLDPASLTAPEADYLLNFRDAGALRDRLAAALRERGQRLGAKGLQQTSEDQGEGRLKLAGEALQPTDAFKAQASAIGTRLRAELDRLGLNDIGLRISENLGLMVDGTMHAADGSYFRKLITVALDAENPDSVLDHEAIHALHDVGAFTKDEWAILERKSRKEWRDRYEIGGAYGSFPDAVQTEEGIAHAYADWRAGRSMDGIIAKAFKKIRGVLQAIGKAFGKDFRTAEDVFAQVASGEVGNRSLVESTGGEEQFKLRNPQTAEDGQKTMQGMIARGQPIDRALRLPFQFFGGVNEKGQWKPGLYLTDKAAKIITTAKIDPEGRFGWLAGPVEAARAGLIDRYGLSPEYVERDRQRHMDERAITMKGAEVLKTLADQNVGPNEARVLQAILTGEAVSDKDMQGLAEPIRQAIDELGQEAVSLGLISADSFERNRGSYLHRVYAKHESEQNNLQKLVSQAMGSKRKKIIGDTLKGRGIFWEVGREQLLRHSSSAQAMRKADSQIGGIEKRVDDMKSRRDVLEGEMEALGRDLALLEARRLGGARFPDHLLDRGPIGDIHAAAQVRRHLLEQAVALNRLRDRIEQRMAAMDKIDGEIAAAQQRIDQLSDHLISQSENLSVTKDSKFIVLDKTVDKGDGKSSVSQRVYLPADEQIPERFNGPEWTNRGTWEARQIGKDKVTLWRDYSQAERTKMGEILDARYTIGKTYLHMAHDLATGRFYKDIAENADWASSSEPATKWVEADQHKRLVNDREVAWVKVPDTSIADTGGKKKWGALSGKWVRSEIWRDLNEIDIMNRPSTWRMLLSQWKLNKTSRSPVTHMNNVMSNLMLMDMQDIRMQDLQAGIRSFINKDKHWQDANEHGVFGADLMTQEIRDNVLKPILEEIEKQGQDGVQNSFLARAGVLGKFADRLWSGAKTADQKMMDAYRIEDDVFRLASYRAGIARGESPEHAAAAAREQFLDYDIHAPWVNAARNSLLPFISYTYRAVPVIARALATRPWKLAKYAMVAYALNALAYAWDDKGDEDKERASLRDEEQGYTWLGTPRMMRMPFRNKDGLPVFLDVRRWIPGGDVFDTNQGSSAVPVPAPLQFGGPLMLAFELALNKSSFTGDPITNDLTDNWFDKTSKVGDYLWKSWMPSAAWVPNSWYWTKIENAIKGATDAKGRPYSLPEAVASSFGVKVKPQDVETGIFWHYKDIKDVETALRAEARTLARQRDRGLISQKAFDAGMQSLLDKRDALVEHVKELQRATRKK